MIVTIQTPPDNISTPNIEDWSTLVQQLLDRQSLSVLQAANLIKGWLAETIPLAQSGAILAAIQAKRVSPEELVGFSQVLRQQLPPQMNLTPTPKGWRLLKKSYKAEKLG